MISLIWNYDRRGGNCWWVNEYIETMFRCEVGIVLLDPEYHVEVLHFCGAPRLQILVSPLKVDYQFQHPPRLHRPIHGSSHSMMDDRWILLAPLTAYQYRNGAEAYTVLHWFKERIVTWRIHLTTSTTAPLVTNSYNSSTGIYVRCLVSTPNYLKIIKASWLNNGVIYDILMLDNIPHSEVLNTSIQHHNWLDPLFKKAWNPAF